MGRKPRTDDGEQVHNRLEPARAAHGLSRQQLADAVGIHYQTAGYLERGEYSPSLVLALRIARLLNTSVEQLFSLDPIGSEPPSANGSSNNPLANNLSADNGADGRR